MKSLSYMGLFVVYLLLLNVLDLKVEKKYKYYLYIYIILLISDIKNLNLLCKQIKLLHKYVVFFYNIIGNSYILFILLGKQIKLDNRNLFLFCLFSYLFVKYIVGDTTQVEHKPF